MKAVVGRKVDIVMTEGSEHRIDRHLGVIIGNPPVPAYGGAADPDFKVEAGAQVRSIAHCCAPPSTSLRLRNAALKSRRRGVREPPGAAAFRHAIHAIADADGVLMAPQRCLAAFAICRPICPRPEGD